MCPLFLFVPLSGFAFYISQRLTFGCFYSAYYFMFIWYCIILALDLTYALQTILFIIFNLLFCFVSLIIWLFFFFLSMPTTQKPPGTKRIYCSVKGMEIIQLCSKLAVVRKWGNSVIGYLNKSYLEGGKIRGQLCNWLRSSCHSY